MNCSFYSLHPLIHSIPPRVIRVPDFNAIPSMPASNVQQTRAEVAMKRKTDRNSLIREFYRLLLLLRRIHFKCGSSFHPHHPRDSDRVQLMLIRDATVKQQHQLQSLLAIRNRSIHSN